MIDYDRKHLWATLRADPAEQPTAQEPTATGPLTIKPLSNDRIKQRTDRLSRHLLADQPPRSVQLDRVQ